MLAVAQSPVMYLSTACLNPDMNVLFLMRGVSLVKQSNKPVVSSHQGCTSWHTGFSTYLVHISVTLSDPTTLTASSLRQVCLHTSATPISIAGGTKSEAGAERAKQGQPWRA